MSATLHRGLPAALLVGMLRAACHAEEPLSVLEHLGERANREIARAMDGMKARIAKAAADRTRPVYHYRPPARWISDPNGCTYYKGFYHAFYIFNPHGGWGGARSFWGHARSKDLVYWEHLPIALAPSMDREHRCNSGCLALDGKGRPMIFYTSVPLGGKPNEQWAVFGDDDLVTWKKYPGNPILGFQAHGEPRFGTHWRDPFVFRENGRTFMVIGAHLGNEAVVPVYEAEDTDLLRWKYRGLLYRVPKSLTHSLERPNFFKLGQKWVLIGSPQTRPYAVTYFSGSLDLKTLRFTPERQGLVDHLDNFIYATDVFQDDQGRCILMARIKHFRPESETGWDGCLALPRILSLDTDGRLLRKPLPELRKLRGQHFALPVIKLNNQARVLENVKGDTLEILITFEPGNARAFGLNVRRSDDGAKAVTIRYDGQGFTLGLVDKGVLVPCRHHHDHPEVPGGRLPFKLTGKGESLTLRIFLDKSVMEVFVGDGRAVATRVIYPGEENLGIELFADGGSATVQSLDIWKMQSIW